ncbi:MAG: site-specific DNA-methyltransferase, partial [Bacteroidaceae bacterium]|nr:site-specific DNA-methyltransferase [Bacteroidaceae bacterium]
KVDCIYIDPPYNTGAKDWKYNNDYVDGSDNYRHSKWLSMMKKRLALAKRLLNPADSVLIVTIDEKEYLHLGCLLEEMFPEARMQMVSSVINPNGSSRKDMFSRSDEYIYYLFFGKAYVCYGNNDMLHPVEEKQTRWTGLIRTGANGKRIARPNLFYPIFFSEETGKFVSVGESLPLEKLRNEIVIPDGCFAVFPISREGGESTWGVQPSTFLDKYEKGYIKFGPWKKGSCYRSVSHLQEGMIKSFERGEIETNGKNEDGTWNLGITNKPITAMTTWVQDSHNAGVYGSSLLKTIFHDIRFSFPKSVYAEVDTLRFSVKDKPNALILDFFAGSGTTLHAVNLL